jgi:hypothetical protein
MLILTNSFNYMDQTLFNSDPDPLQFIRTGEEPVYGQDLFKEIQDHK